MQLDLNDLNSVKAFGEAYCAKYDRLDTLMMNAGIMALPERETTAQGFEKQFGTNHIGHFFLSKLLLDKVKASSEGRIVVLSSLAHKNGKMRFDDIGHETSYSTWDAYAMSKLANIYYAKHLAQELENEGVQHVKVVSLHPGVCRTELTRYMMNCCMKILMVPIYPFFYACTKSPWYGA